jgi:hypothetical protein
MAYLSFSKSRASVFLRAGKIKPAIMSFFNMVAAGILYGCSFL